MEQKLNNIPKHVAIIMDGNGRWAKLRNKERIEGHKEGVESVRACCKSAAERGIKYLSVFAFSTENWGRPKAEVEGIWSLMLKAIAAETPTFMKNNVRFRVIGDLAALSTQLQDEIKECMALTEKNSGTNLVVFMNYSGKWDILHAVNAYIKEHPSEEITEPMMEKYLSTNELPAPDLLIRTSGEKRISNFLLWQTAYTEFYFTDTLWPDFREEEFRKALEYFSIRERRYGKIL